MGKGRNTSGLAHEVSHGCTDVYQGLDLPTRPSYPMVLLECFPQRKYHCPLQHYQNLWGTVVCLVWVCSNDTGCSALVMKVSALLWIGLLALVLECWWHCLLGLTGLLSSELVNTDWWHVKLQCMCPQGECPSWCSGVVGDWPKFAGLRDNFLHGWNMIDSWFSAERGGDVEVFTPTLITFILLCKLNFKTII